MGINRPHPAEPALNKHRLCRRGVLLDVAKQSSRTLRSRPRTCIEGSQAKRSPYRAMSYRYRDWPQWKGSGPQCAMFAKGSLFSIAVRQCSGGAGNIPNGIFPGPADSSRQPRNTPRCMLNKIGLFALSLSSSCPASAMNHRLRDGSPSEVCPRRSPRLCPMRHIQGQVHAA